jgi:hypothetical protein
MPTANAETMSLHSDAISRKIAPGAHALLVFDGAGYHGAGALAGALGHVGGGDSQKCVRKSLIGHNLHDPSFS